MAFSIVVGYDPSGNGLRPESQCWREEKRHSKYRKDNTDEGKNTVA